MSLKDRAIDPMKARKACVTLIEAYCRNPEDVDWSDIQIALEHALKAFGLPLDYPDHVFNEANPED